MPVIKKLKKASPPDCNYIILNCLIEAFNRVHPECKTKMDITPRIIKKKIPVWSEYYTSVGKRFTVNPQIHSIYSSWFKHHWIHGARATRHLTHIKISYWGVKKFLRIWCLRAIDKKMSFCEDIPRWIKQVPKHLKTQEMCNEEVGIEPCSLVQVLDHFKTGEMCNDAVEKDPYRLGDVPVRYRMARVFEKIIERYPGALIHAPNWLKTVKMCERPIEADPWQLYHTPDHFKTHKMCDIVVRWDP